MTTAVLLLLACTPSSPPVSAPAASPAPQPEVTAPEVARAPLEPPVLRGVSAAGASSSPLVLARLDDRDVLVLADADERRVVIVDRQTGEQLVVAPLSGTPAHAIVDRDGAIHVAIRDRAEVVALALECAADPCTLQLVERDRWSTPEEPIALAVADAGASILVSCGWGRAIASHPIATNGRAWTIPVAAEPRGIVVDHDAGRAFVSHAVGSRVTVLSLAEVTVEHERALHWRDDVAVGEMRLTNVPRFAVQGIALAMTGGDVIAPMVLAYPGDAETEALGYGMTVEGIAPFFGHEPVIATLDRASTQTRLRLRHEVVDADRERVSEGRRAYAKHRRPCLLPRSTAIDVERSRVLVACQDLGQVIALSTEHTTLEKAESTRWTVGTGTDALAIDSQRGDAWTWSPFDRRLDRIRLADDGAAAPEHTITLAASAEFPDAAGRIAFHTPRASDGRSCAGCHVDGRDDGIVWQSPRGLVQTPVLAGRTTERGPFGWQAEEPTLTGHIRRTFSRLEAGKPDDATVAALAGYLASMPAHRPSAIAHDLTDAQARGRDVFRSAKAACADCHIDDDGTDGATHRIGRSVAQKTPSLRFVADTAPYMHDGRYATLRETLAHTDSTMGSTAALGDREVADLVAYLGVL